jgi:cytochrome c-type biogenesis protein CcmH/NrfF
MTEDKFFERLREDAQSLRHEGDDFLAARIAARVRERMTARPPTVAQLLAAWMRPVAASLAAIVLCVTIGLTWSQQHQQEPGDTSISSNPIEIAMAGELYGVDD